MTDVCAEDRPGLNIAVLPLETASENQIGRHGVFHRLTEEYR